MPDRILATAIEFREHWGVFKRAVHRGNPLAHEWMWTTGERIRVSGKTLRRWLGYDNPHNLEDGTAETDGTHVFINEGKRHVHFMECATEERADEVRDNLNELCPAILVAAGTAGYAGRRSLYSRSPRTRNATLSDSSLSRLQELSSSSSRLKRPELKQRPYKGPRAIVQDTTVYIRHKGCTAWYADCVTNLGAETAAAKVNRRNGWPDKLPVATPTGVLKRRNCPYCGKNVATSWLKRHVERYHQDDTS